MNKEKLRELIREELKNEKIQALIVEATKIDLELDEMIVFKLQGPFTQQHYKDMNEAVTKRFGNRAIVLGTTKDYNIEITKGRIKDGKSD